MSLSPNPRQLSGSPFCRAAGVASLLAVLLALPATADWLVTREGAEIETSEPWEVKGKLVVFTLASGTLSSMRLSEIDLEASQRLTDQRARSWKAATEMDKAPKKAVLVLRDEDVAHVGPSGGVQPRAEQQEAGSEAAARPGTQPAAPGRGVEVDGWRHAFNDSINGVELEGTLRNFGKAMAVDVSMQVILYGERGRLVGTGTATIENPAIGPGEISPFRAVFPGILGFERPDFQVKSTPLVMAPATESEDGEGFN